MAEHDSLGDPSRPEVNGAIRPVWRLIALSVGVTGVVVACTIGWFWYKAFASSLTASWIRNHLYEEMLVIYMVALALVPTGLIVSSTIALLARRNGNRRLASRSGRVFLVFFGLLIGVGLCEVVCGWKLESLARLTHPPTFRTGEESPKPVNQDRPLREPPKTRPETGTIDVVTIGGSSAHGVPFQPRLSLDRIITWQLGRAFPDKTFKADNRAIPGIRLDQAIEKLVGLERRPDLLIVYSGHNEFQSRFGWGRKAPYYRLEPTETLPVATWRARSYSYAAEFLAQNADRFAIESAPPPRAPEELADTPCCTQAEYATTLSDYRRRLDGLLGDCDAAGILTIVVVPPSNDGGFDPNRSVLSPETTRDERIDFIARFTKVVRNQSVDPNRAMSDYRRLLVEQPTYAEAHYRLAQLLEAAGSYSKAHDEYILARDVDGVPFRCPTPFLEACREVAKRHKCVLVDAPRLFESASAHGIINDRLLADAHHPSLNAFVIIAKDAIRGLKRRHAFGWPDSTPIPQFSLADCVNHFKLDTEAWIDACTESRKFYEITAILPRDPAWRQSISARYDDAIKMLEAGKSPAETSTPSLKIDEELQPDPSLGAAG